MQYLRKIKPCIKLRIKPYFYIAPFMSVFAVLTPQLAHAQSAGEVIFIETFGTGVFPTGQALPAGTTNFTFFEPPQPALFNAAAPNSGIVNDGFYTIGTNTQQAFANWASIEDNTPGDVNGLMLIVNARENEVVNGQLIEDEFYRQTVSLTPNTNFEFLTFITPTNSVGDQTFCETQPGGFIVPNVRFSVEDLAGNVLATDITGEIPFSATPSFEPFSIPFFTSAATTDVQIVLSNVAPGGCGNDIAIDDITFRIAITAQAEDDSATVADTITATPSVFNLVDNDTLDGAPFPAPNAAGSNTVLTIESPVPPELTFDPLTGIVGVVQGAAAGEFSFDYQICETANLINCSIATATVTIDGPALPAGGGICPSGQTAVTQEGFAIDAFSSDPFANNGAVSTNSAGNAIGPILADGAVDTGAESVQVFFPNIDLEFTAAGDPLLPENSVVLLSVGQFFGNNGQALVQFSVDGSSSASFTGTETIGFGNTAGSLATLTQSNTFQQIPVTIPAGGARFIRLDHQSGGYRVDGGQRNEICQIANLGPQLAGSKIVEGAVDGQFSIPGEDVVYTIQIENIGDNAVDDDTIFLIDALPAEVIFLNAPFADNAGNTSPDPVFFEQAGGAGLNYNFATDIGFSSSTTPPTNLSQCTDTLVPGENPDINFICFNPKGAMAAGTPNPSFAFKFRTRIE